METKKTISRRLALKTLGIGAAAIGGTIAGGLSMGSQNKKSVPFEDKIGEYFQKHYQKMTPEEVKEAIERLERKYKIIYDAEVTIRNDPPLKNVLFGYALNISKCKGYRECVKACELENNLGHDSEMQYIRVLEMDKGSMDLESGEHYYGNDEEVPRPGKFYLPIQCHQCEDSPCQRACPINATWREDDGVIVVDYNWCIGCRMCMNACPYWARRFNWNSPALSKEKINKNTHYLGNRPREKGVVEKCTFCLQRTREGRMPACQEACPTGSRIFGNLLDPKSEIRYILENKNIFRLKEELNTQPKFWYYSD